MNGDYTMDSTSSDIALPDLSMNSDLNYDSTPTTGGGSDGWSLNGILSTINMGVDTYNKVQSVIVPKSGSVVAQPVTIVAPQSAQGNNSQLGNTQVGTKVGFFDRMASKFGVAVGVVWAVVGVVTAVVLYGGFKLVKGR